ncbi:uncharacterized protein A1O9_06748 [Exophiala aquamarina CBS 119918]|uniref:Clr5 domain-containing protein n=1 Tax=Exophiala aquamarina CBS 119918 TaxID=1182545 RepID=A0A072PLZ2_9EURO|nr:uncharacterized protein A1O9_06748 [Exophiala aquamarina CBS 119918]KEF56560.1 hypothetical protein A1O9_06748 [Exophiala aquamarina CBS 119918]
MGVNNDFRTWDPQKPRRAEAISGETWASFRAMITDWHARGLTKKEILGKLSVEHSFFPSKSQLVARMGLWDLHVHRRAPLALDQSDLSLDDLFTSPVTSVPPSRPPNKSVYDSRLRSSKLTPQYMPKSISAPTVLTFTDNVRPFDRLTVTSSSTSLSAQFQSHRYNEIFHSRWAPTNPNGVDIFIDHLNSLLQYFPQRLLFHDRFFGAEAICTMDQLRVERLLKLASYLSAGNLLRDSFDTYLTCFATTVFYFPTALSTSEDDFPYADEQFATWLLQRIREITRHSHILGFLVTSAVGCVRSSCTLDDASCAGRLLRILMSILSEGTGRFLALLTLLHHYHRDLEQFWSPIGFEWTSTSACHLMQENVAEDVFSTLIPDVKDRELVFLSSKEQIEFAFPTDNFWVGSKLFDIAHDKIARQFIGNAFIRSKAFDLLGWCKITFVSKQRSIEERLVEVQDMKLEYEEFQDIASQLLFWCFIHEKTCSNGSPPLDESAYASSSFSRFGINIPDAFAVVAISVTKKAQWPKTFKDLASGTLQPSTLLTWLLKRLQMLMTEDGILEFIYRYFRRMLRHQSGGVSNLLPSATSTGRRFAHMMAEHLFGNIDASCVPTTANACTNEANHARRFEVPDGNDKVAGFACGDSRPWDRLFILFDEWGATRVSLLSSAVTAKDMAILADPDQWGD